MYAQRGHGKRSCFYSDYTFGVWRDGEDGSEELVPVGKAYFGFTDEELMEIDKYVRDHTIEPLRPGARGRARGACRPGLRGRLRGLAALDPAQVRASPCAFPGSTASAGTSRRAKPTISRYWKRCCRPMAEPQWVAALRCRCLW